MDKNTNINEEIERRLREIPGKRMINTQGDLIHYRKMRAENPKKWNEWLRAFFHEKPLKEVPRYRWLMGLRVLNGLSRDDMGMATSSYEIKEKESGKPLTSLQCDQLLEDNILHLPVDEQGKVLPDYAKKLREKLTKPCMVPGPKIFTPCATTQLGVAVPAKELELHMSLPETGPQL